MGLENQDIYKNEVKINFFQLYDGTFQLCYERLINDNNSLLLLGAVTAKEKDFYKIFGINSELQYRHYFNDVSNKNLKYFLGSYIMHKYREETNLNYSLKSFSYSTDNYTYDNIYGAGVIGGVKLILFNRINMDFSIGGGIKYSTSNKSDGYQINDENIFSPHYSGVAPKLNLMFSFAF